MNGISIAQVVRQINFLFSDGTDETLGVSILPGFACLGHTDLHIGLSEHPDTGTGRVLEPLIRMMNLWCVMSQRSLQSDQGKRLIQATSKMPATDATGEHVHDHHSIVSGLLWRVANLPYCC
jgi:hypothetical protein